MQATRERIALLIWWLGLAALLTALAPASSAALPLGTRAVYWLAHAGIGLLLLVLALRLVEAREWFQRRPDWVSIVAAGILGALAFAPLALALETLFPASELPDTDPRWLLALEQSGLPGALLVEWLELTPEFVLIWLLVNLSLPVGRGTPRAASAAEAAEPPPAPAAPVFEGLPERLGRELVCLQAELNYVHVTTTRGRAMVLSTLSRAMEGLEGEGIQVHRSWWVADAHVTRVRRTSRGYRVELSNGEQVPVSRRRQKPVLERFGRDVRYEPAARAS